MALNIPTDYQPTSVRDFLKYATAAIDDYVNNKNNLQGLAAPLSEVTVAAGNSQVIVTDPNQLAQINQNASQVLVAAQNEYLAELAAVSGYLDAAVAAQIS